MIEAVKKYLLELQNKICESMEQEDGGASFIQDHWQYPTGGGGETRIIMNGTVFEKGGANFSHISGLQLPAAATSRRPEWACAPFQALGVSVVMHPVNPYVPTSHFNVRFIEVSSPHQGGPHWWFGGGFDLTPYYGFVEDCVHWHQMAKRACDPFGPTVYPLFKEQADEYFFLKHRNEARGIGGIFFDDLHEWGFDTSFAFIRSVGEHYIEAYRPIVAKRKRHPYHQKEKNFQLYRRGRYVEFNLLYDRGTLFGLQSQGRTESILMSLPPTVAWEYDFRPEPGSKEADLYEHFLCKKEWHKEGLMDFCDAQGKR